jgi:hypothetical protein
VETIREARVHFPELDICFWSSVSMRLVRTKWGRTFRRRVQYTYRKMWFSALVENPTGQVDHGVDVICIVGTVVRLTG